MGRWLSVAAVVLVLAGCKRERSAPPGAQTSKHRSIWFDDLGQMDVSSELASNVARFVWHGIHGKATALAELPERPALIFASISDGKTGARVVLGAGKTLSAAARAVVQLARAAALEVRWLQLDVVTRVRRYRPGARLSRGLDGVATASQLGKAYPPGAYMIATAAERKALAAQAQFAFRTRAVFYDGRELVPLFRGHRRRSLSSPAALLAAARAGGDYLARMRDEDGRFVYSYAAARDADRGGYNLVRHAGTVYAMFQLYRVTKDAALARAASQSLDYLLRFVKPYGRHVALVSDDRIKLGGVALAAVAIAEHIRATGDRRHLATAQKLCGYIVASQAADGSYVHSRSLPSGKPRAFRSQYYPGEAMLALMRVHAIDGDMRWVDSAARAAAYLIGVRDKGKATAELTHDHWLLYALNELYRRRKRAEYLTHAKRIVEAIVSSQNRNAAVEDHAGSWYRRPRSTPAATRSEGLLAAHALMSEVGDQQLAQRIRRAVELAVGFQLHTQITRERAMYVRNPRRSLGGFTRSLTNFEVRIDYVQHNISALILLHQLLSP